MSDEEEGMGSDQPRPSVSPNGHPAHPRLLVCGGRDFTDQDFIYSTLLNLNAARGPFSCVIHGCATDADHEGMIWAEMMGIKHAPFRADWHAHGRAAGPIRNQRMIDEGKPDLVVAFPGGRGTADMVRRAVSAGIPVVLPTPSTTEPL